MADNTKTIKQQYDKKEQPKFKSPYGSHKDMIDKVKTEKLSQANKVVCTDSYGDYITDINMIDSGLADINRYDEIKRFGKYLNVE